MSTPALAHAAPHHDAEENKFQLFVQIAMLLAVITGIEIITVYLPFASWLLVTTLVVFSAVKFMFVIFIFMHLRWDKPFCTILFFIGLILASGTMWALLKLFGAAASIPLSSAGMIDGLGLLR
jgi:cytochrome c oxidase subunit 4